MAPFISIAAVLATVPLAFAKCYDPSPAFPYPVWTDNADDLKFGFKALEHKLDALISKKKYDISSYSISVTSNIETLWESHHSARKLDKARPGDTSVDGDSLYRIASISKTFTTLAILKQHQAGNLSLDDPIDKYIPELTAKDKGALPWKDITLRILASQLSGIPRNFNMGDLYRSFPDPTVIGLPPGSDKNIPNCDPGSKSNKPCEAHDLFDNLKTLEPVFAPNQKSTYSNIAFVLLGLAVKNVTGMSYEDYIEEAIFKPLNMSSSALTAPSSDEHAVLPATFNYWDFDLGIQNPTGGIFSSTNDMAKYQRYVLQHFNSIATGVNWLLPVSWGGGVNSFYGMPFETFRTDKVLKDSQRPVVFVSKGGALPGYYTRIIFLEDYGLGITILTSGETSLVDELQELVTTNVVQYAEDAIWRDVDKTYTGKYVSTDKDLNSSLELGASSDSGLVLNSFISNNTDIFRTLIPLWVDDHETEPWRVQLTPTLLYKNETAQQGEIWRFTVSYERAETKGHTRKIWDDFCMTDVDPLTYSNLPLTEVVFWHEEGLLELPAWEVTMKMEEEESGPALVVQQR